MTRLKFLFGTLVAKIFGTGILGNVNADGEFVPYPPLTVINNSPYGANIGYRGKFYKAPPHRTLEIESI